MAEGAPGTECTERSLMKTHGMGWKGEVVGMEGAGEGCRQLPAPPLPMPTHVMMHWGMKLPWGDV